MLYSLAITSKLWLWLKMSNATFNNNSVMMAVSFIGGGTQRKTTDLSQVTDNRIIINCT
jgi:hypothetical protein